MYIFLKTAKKKTKNHADYSSFMVDGPKTIVKGEVYLAISNGTIGRGARQKNIGNKQAIKMLENFLKKLKENNLEESKSETRYEFNPNDVPFWLTQSIKHVKIT